MNTDEILSRTFAEHEGASPEPEAVLAAVHARLSRRRRATPLVAAAAMVVAIAVGASVLVGQRGPANEPPATDPTPTPSATGTNRTPPPDPSAGADPLVKVPLAKAALSTVAIDTTWLPPGATKNTALGLFYGRQTREYYVTDSGGRITHISLAVRSGSALTPDDGVDRGEARDLTLGGRPAREWRTGDVYSVVVRLPENRVAQVDVSLMTGTSGTFDMVAAGRRIATSLRFDRPERIEPEFRPTYLPKGLAVRAVGRSSDALGGTQWALATPDAPPQGPWVAMGEDPRPGTSPTLPQPVVSGRPVQGHPTHAITDGDQVTLYVDRFVSGKSLTISATSNLVPLAELYRIADGTRLTG